MPTASSNVRVREQSGKHMLALSSSDFDPKRTLTGVGVEGRLRAISRSFPIKK
jgi:hypothetical protein